MVKPDDVEVARPAIMVARENSSMQMLMRMRLSSVKLLGSASGITHTIRNPAQALLMNAEDSQSLARSVCTEAHHCLCVSAV